ncbi:MAG: hypothetical protein J1G38_03055 [Clostridiales bacterium]|nr:hypothetical protein [Clostridiales bacterium]
MENDKKSNVAIKTAAIVIIAVCLVSAFMGLIGFFSFKQMLDADVLRPDGHVFVEKKLTDKFSTNTIILLVEAFIALALFLIHALHLIPYFDDDRESAKWSGVIVSVVCVGCMIVVMIMSIIAISQAFGFIDKLPNKEYKDYYDYTYYQEYQGAALSTFVPLLVASVVAVVYNIVTAVSYAAKKIPIQPVAPSNDKTDNK